MLLPTKHKLLRCWGKSYSERKEDKQLLSLQLSQTPHPHICISWFSVLGGGVTASKGINRVDFLCKNCKLGLLSKNDILPPKQHFKNSSAWLFTAIVNKWFLNIHENLRGVEHPRCLEEGKSETHKAQLKLAVCHLLLFSWSLSVVRDEGLVSLFYIWMNSSPNASLKLFLLLFKIII